ncbi:hypothetical protein JTE90_004607 [Oedothorax gibbosus]|uniref:Uncharacterized protein n=1 Tax=Oedothorax gibbosus TaxID=931172 RepID=A0AAV6UL74_9ARAC|nr:hypothetical protein JTE90_004607 [Oedothorax gibbosus]
MPSLDKPDLPLSFLRQHPHPIPSLQQMKKSYRNIMESRKPSSGARRMYKRILRPALVSSREHAITAGGIPGLASKIFLLQGSYS